MQTARSLTHNRLNFATGRALNRVVFTTSSMDGLQSMPRNVRTWIPFFTTLLQWGYDGVKTSIGALAAAHYRANAGANRSERAAYNALRWLEDRSWLTRRTLRLGSDRLGVILEINRSKFSYFTKRAEVRREPTSVTIPHNGLHLQAVQGDLLSITGASISKPCTTNANQANSKDRANSAVSTKKTDLGRPTHYQSPIRYTCFLLLADSPDRKRVLSRLDAELAGKTTTATLDWSYWSTRWRQMGHDEREHFASLEILPAIRKRFSERTAPLAPAPEQSRRVIDELGKISVPGFDDKENADLSKIQSFLMQSRENLTKK